MERIEKIAAQIYRQHYFEGLVNPVLEECLQDLALVVSRDLGVSFPADFTPKAPHVQHKYIITLAISQV
jgi:hypothetical protein